MDKEDNLNYEQTFLKLKILRENIEDHIMNKSIHNEVKINYNSQFSDKRKMIGK